MASYYILKPVREAFFLQTQGADKSPHGHIAVAFSSFLAVLAYGWLLRRFSVRSLATWIYASFVVTIVAFWRGLVAQPAGGALDALAWSYYIWVSLFSVFAVMLFWSFAHDIFTPDEGSSYYGLIGAGGIFGGLVGGGLTKLLVSRMGPLDIVLVSAALLIPCVIIAVWLGAWAPSTRALRERKPRAQDGGPGVIEVFAGSPYLRAILALVFLFQAIAVLCDQQTKLIVSAAFKSQTEKTQFYNEVYFAMNLLGMLINAFITGPVQSRFGPLPGLICLPVLGIGAAIMFRVAPVIEVAQFVTVVGLALGYSIHQSSKELLYLPVPATERFVAKGFIDTFIFRLGNGGAAMWLVFAQPASGSWQICGVLFAASALMVGVGTWLVPRHTSLLETSPTPKP